jgi:predicted DNA-binding protein
MPVGKDKSSIATVVPLDLKKRLERVATSKKWTLSQTVKECLETFIDQWERELGIVEEPVPTPKKHSAKSVP